MAYHNVQPKKISKEKFLKCIELFCDGKVSTTTCAKALGISYPTFVKRANVFLSGQPVPEEWFLGEDDNEEEKLKKWETGVRKVPHYDNSGRRKKAAELRRAKRSLERAAERRRPKN